MLSEISQTAINTVWFHLYVESQKQNKWTRVTQNSHRYREQIGDFQKGGDGKRSDAGSGD